MATAPKIMNNEILKYQDRIYYLNIRQDKYGQTLKPCIEKANWIYNTRCYDHNSFELHHVIKYGQYERNKEYFEKRGLNMCLILIPKIMHQHLENPVYELSDEEFYRVYMIHKWELLFIKTEYNKGNYPDILNNTTEYEYDGCFDDIEMKGVC
jgi:hypothetical protein